MILKSTKYVLSIIIGAPIYWASKCFPKDKGLAVIGSSLGKHFSDNSKYFYIYHHHSSELKKSRKLVWISKSKEVVKQLNAIGLPAKLLYSFSGVFTVLNASEAYISHQLKDIDGPLMGGAKIVQLWHGMPLRKIGYGGDWEDKNLKGKVKLFISKWLPYNFYMKCDVLLAPCQKAKVNYIEPFSKSFRNNKIAENIFLARQPRTLCFEYDFILNDEFFPEKELLFSFRNSYEKIISWLPTQRRQFGKTILDVIVDSQLDLNELNEFGKSRNYLFVIKAHFLDYDETSKIIQDLDFIYVYPYSDPYPLLKFTDILITDYSSVFFDFLLLNRPILFMCYDLEDYRMKTKFYYDYESLEMGPICKSWEMVLQTLMDLTDDKDDYVLKRTEALNRFDFKIESKIKIPDEL